MSTGVALSNNSSHQPTPVVYLQQFGGAVTSVSSNNNTPTSSSTTVVVPSSSNNSTSPPPLNVLNQPPNVVSSSSSSSGSSSSSYISKSNPNSTTIAGSCLAGQQQTSSLSSHQSSLTTPPGLPSSKGENQTPNSAGVASVISASKPPIYSHGASPQISSVLSSSGRSLQQAFNASSNTNQHTPNSASKVSGGGGGTRPLQYGGLTNRPASAIVSSSSSSSTDYPSSSVATAQTPKTPTGSIGGGGLSTSTSPASAVVGSVSGSGSAGAKGQQMSSMNQPYPLVPDTLLNSAFMLPSSTGARRTGSSINSSPLFSQASSLNSSSMLDMSVPSSPLGGDPAQQQPPSKRGVSATTPSGIPPGSTTSSASSANVISSASPNVPSVGSESAIIHEHVRRVEEENSLMCEELQATVAELSEAREISKQLALQRDQGEARLQSILRCIYEQNTVLDQCCGQMDFLRALVDDSSASAESDSLVGGGGRKGAKSCPSTSLLGGGDIDGIGCMGVQGGLDGSTDEETDTEKTPEEVSASCVRKLNRLEVLLKHKLKEDKAMRNAMKKTNQALRDREMEVEMLKVRLEASQQRKATSTSHHVAAESNSSSSGGETKKKENRTPTLDLRRCSEATIDRSRLPGGSNVSGSVVETLSSQYEELLRRKEQEMQKLREELHKTVRNAKAVESIRRLKPGEADRDELLLLQDRIDKLTDEKHESETARDDLSRDLIRSKAEMTSQIEALAAQLQELERDRMDWKSRFEQIEKEIQQVKDATDEKIADMAVALVVTHDFQREETEKKEMVEAELESAKSKLVRLESDLSKQRTENDSLKRSLESERQSHRVELSNAHKHADELSTNVALLKQQLVDSRKTDASVPKIARVQSMLEPGSAEGHRRSAALFGAGVSRRTGSSADESDCIDDSPISGCNVRSMIQTLETTPSSAMTSSGALEASSVTKPSSQPPITPQSSSSTLNDEVPLPGSLKSKKLLGASKHDKRRSSVPTTTVTKLDPIADEPGSPSGGAMGVGGSSGGSTSPGYKLSASVRSKREKFESSDEVLAPPPPVNRPPRSTRNQVSSGGLESSSRAFRSPLNKLKINDIVVTRGSVARDKRAATVVGNNSSPSPAAATNTGSNSSAHNSDNEGAHHVKSGAAPGGSTSATGAKTVTQTHVLSGGLGGGGADPIVTIEGGSSGSSDASLSGAGVGVGVGVENKALKEIMQKGSHVSVRNAILDWCKQVTAGFPGVEVTNFSSSWNDGLAFCAIFYSHSSPHHLKAFPSFHSLRSQTKKQNFDVATALANVLGIPFNIDDVNKIISTDRPEWRVILPVVKAIFEDIALRGDQK